VVELGSEGLIDVSDFLNRCRLEEREYDIPLAIEGLGKFRIAKRSVACGMIGAHGGYLWI
jgi:hypothetical protein